MLEIFLRTILGEEINVRELADDYGVSTKSITRDISEIRNFLYDKRELSNFTDLKYSGSSKTYSIEFDNILLSKELIAIIKAMIGCRAFSKEELQTIINKLKTFTSRHDATMLDQIIGKEMLHYSPVGSDCESVIDQLWKLTRCIHERKEISVSYYKVNRKLVTRRIMPVAITSPTITSTSLLTAVIKTTGNRSTTASGALKTLLNTGSISRLHRNMISTSGNSGRKYSSCSPANSGRSSFLIPDLPSSHP